MKFRIILERNVFFLVNLFSSYRARRMAEQGENFGSLWAISSTRGFAKYDYQLIQGDSVITNWDLKFKTKFV